MNEEELKKGCGLGFWYRGFWYRDIQFVYCGDKLFLCPTCQARLEGFQKGKLEAIKDELNFLREIEKGTSCIDTKMFLKLRIEQLQKEIGEEKGK
jgi:hypothetical protein